MAFRLSSENVMMIERELLDELEYWSTSDKDNSHTLTYIAGVHDMANAVIKAIKELGGR